MPEFKIGSRWVGDGHAPLVIAEAGIHHGGSMDRARTLVDEARAAGAEVVKFQSHIPSAEMTEFHPWSTTITEASFTEAQELELKCYTEQRGMMFMSTPFSIAAVDRLAALGVPAFKIGSGECSNIPLIECAASYGKPIIISTGMHSLDDVRMAVDVVDGAVPYAVLHCTSEYPTQYQNVRLGALAELRAAFPRAVVGLSCHSLGIYTALAAVALGASIIEKHFKAAVPWNGPDAEVSISPRELGELIAGSRAIHAAKGGSKAPVAAEAACAKMAKHYVVAARHLSQGESLDRHNTTLARTDRSGGIPAAQWDTILGCYATRSIPAGQPIGPSDLA